ncbi:MAG: ATP-binding protein [Chloroflexota bacterium]
MKRGLALRLAAAFAVVAIATAAAVAIATPIIVGHGFARVLVIGDDGPPGAGSGSGQGRGRNAGLRAHQVEQDTTLAIILVAITAAGVASLLGVAVARRIARPLERLERVAAQVAAGDLTERSGIADRRDEVGSLGRSFDAMAATLEQDEQARRRLIQDVSHELRTPLTVIDATVDAMLDGVWEREDRHLLTIRSQSHLLARIVDDLRTVAQAESGRMALELQPVALDPLLAETVSGFRARAERADVRLSVGSPAGLVVQSDPARLAQVLGALIDNALNHTPRGGTIEVAGMARGDRAEISVRDTGPGIAAEDLPHVFERFYRADPARGRATGGSGLGLAIVAALMRAMGGSASAANDPAGGAVFCLSLPRHAA